MTPEQRREAGAKGGRNSDRTGIKKEIKMTDLKLWASTLTAKDKVKLTDFLARAEKVRID